MSWYYDYPANRMLEMWRSDHSIGYPYPNATAVFDGHKGDYDIYIHEFKTCIKFSFGMGIARPDSFVPAITNGTLAGRECHLGYWADRYTVPIGGQYGDFDAWFHIDSTFPLEFRGVTIPTVLAAFEHTNTVPIFKYGSVDPTSQDISPVDDKFFPDFVGSLDGLDQLFTDFENMKGKCHQIPMFLEQISEKPDEELQSLMDSFEQAKENLSGQDTWPKFEVLKGHAIKLAHHLQDKYTPAQDTEQAFLN